MSPSQSPGLPLVGVGQGSACTGEGRGRPVLGHPPYLSMTTAADMKCILCARHVDSVVLPAISQSLLLSAQVLEVEAEASQPCLALTRWER